MRIQRRLALVVAAASAITVHACASAEPTASMTVGPRTACASPEAFAAQPVSGTSLPPHTLALTFDDGPGPRTAELAAYLEEQGIVAAFFVNGMWVLDRPWVLPQLVARGHVIGNHTQQHLDLSDPVAFPATAAGDAALIAAVAQTDDLLAPYLENGRRLFRAPFGRWDARAFAVLEASPMNGYVGPIEWEIGDSRTATSAADWACWQQAPALTTKACGDLYLTQITRVDRGIVLMHDADYGDGANHALTTGVGNTVDMVKYLVPILKAAGFAFVRVDHVPAIEAQLPPLPPVQVEAGVDAGVEPDASAEADAGVEAGAAPGGAPPKAPDSTGTAAASAPVPSPASSPPRDDGPCAAPPRAPPSRDAH